MKAIYIINNINLNNKNNIIILLKTNINLLIGIR